MPTLLQHKPASGRRGDAGILRRGYGDGGRSPEDRPPAPTTSLVGVGALLAAVTMLFIAFTSAYLARRQEDGWLPIAVPPVLWLTTAMLLASSATLERARSRIARGDALGFRRGLSVTAALGVLFVLGQLVAWRQLSAQGLYLASTPHSAFFYLLTGAHGLHLLGGLGALGVVLLRAQGGAYTPRDHAGVRVFALYWHFMDGLWLYLFALLFWA
jgi:cytochrome c oxidase subunit III